MYQPGCAAVRTFCTAKPGCVAQAWQGYCVGSGRKGADAEAAENDGRAWEKFKNLGRQPGAPDETKPSPQILANCEIGYSFSTVSGAKHFTWLEDATKVWQGACVDGKSRMSLYQATGRGSVTFPNGSKFEGEFQDGRAWTGSGEFWNKDGVRFKGKLRDGTPWQGVEERRNFDTLEFETVAIYRDGKGFALAKKKPDEDRQISERHKRPSSIEPVDPLPDLSGHYRIVTGITPWGTSYGGTVAITQGSDDMTKYCLKWDLDLGTASGCERISTSSAGKLTLTVDWGAPYPAIYDVVGDGKLLVGLWDNGAGKENLQRQ